MMRTGSLLSRLLPVFVAAALLGGCASSGNPRDPLEGFNRAMYSFNEGLDRAVIKPAAQGYEAVLPQPVRTGISNFFSNIGDVFIAVNNLLQGKLPRAASDAGRVLVNSTVGILGLIDVASEVGLEKHEEDFGQTLARWGVGNGPYVVLPFFGPRTLRDAVALPLDLKADPVAQVDHVPTRNSALVVRTADDRADLLKVDKTLEEAALDKYAFVRDAYLQHRRSLIYDGNPPREREEWMDEEENDDGAGKADRDAKADKPTGKGDAR